MQIVLAFYNIGMKNPIKTLVAMKLNTKSVSRVDVARSYNTAVNNFVY